MSEAWVGEGGMGGSGRHGWMREAWVGEGGISG